MSNPDNLAVPGKKGNIHIAHRRSPSELTNLMVEQYNLQRQLEQLQAQQRQLLEQQQLQYTYPQDDSQQYQNQSQPLNPSYRSHSRSSSINSQSGQPNTHRRTNSGLGQGHNRRHSLQLNEAIKAAANQRQQNSKSITPTTPVLGEDNSSSFKFPSQNNPPESPGHGRSRSLAYGQPFKFPAENAEGSLLPPTPNFQITSPDRGHQRRGSHYRSNSRNFDPNGAANMSTNWRSQQQSADKLASNLPPTHSRQSSALEPPLFVPGHKPRNSSYGGSGSIGSLSQFLPQQGNNASNGRKSLFAPYLPQATLPELINEGRLVTGTLRVNKKNRSDAYVSTDGLLDADIFICGSKDRNRALEGDLVAVELLVVDEVWDSKKEKEEKKRRKDLTSNKPSGSLLSSGDIHNDATSSASVNVDDESSAATGDGDDQGLGRRGSLKQRPTMKKNDDVEVEGQSLLLVEEEEINDEIKPLYAGHVVAVVDRIPGQLFAGTLGLLRPAQAAQAARDKKNGKESSVQTPKAPKIVWFKPTDKKVPLIAIPTEQAPRDFVENHEKYANELFVASIKRWPITSLHPFGTLISKLGKIDEPETEIDSILRDNNFLFDEYADSAFYDLRAIESELANEKRTEYLNDYIISFTPTGDFVDHALHVKRLSNTKIELGFHSADISYFVEPGSTLDRRAKKRSTSVFLPQKVTHLFPPEVNKAVSFKENERNLAVSVVFEIDTANFEVEDLYIHQSVIVPKQLVDYDSFDSILAGKSVESISSATSDYIKTFSLIAKEFRRQRLENKELDITPNLTLLDQLDDERVRLDLNVFKDSLAFDIISEITIKVNNAVASKIHSTLGDQAFLRRQPLPTLQKMETFVRKASNLGFKIDTTTSATLQNSILSIEDPVKRQCVEILLYKCMPRGKYYVAGKQDSDTFGHYYYNLPLYAHFTSPLRRYADLIVHRQLKQVLNKIDSDRDLDSLKATADYCNFKKDCAVFAQEQAIHLLLSQSINRMSGTAGQLLCMGTVIQVYESAFDVFIPEFGVEKRVHGDQLPLVKAEFDKNERTLELYWEKGVDAATYVPPDEKTSLSYRSSIKNKHRSSALDAARSQSETQEEDYNQLVEKLKSLNMELPKLKIPSFNNDGKDNQVEATKSMPSSPIRTSSFPKTNVRTNSSSGINSETAPVGGLQPYLQNVTTKVEGDSHIQVIKELQQVPVLIRAEIGMALPCLTVRTLNPFANDS
jgi:protein SSD1